MALLDRSTVLSEMQAAALSVELLGSLHAGWRQTLLVPGSALQWQVVAELWLVLVVVEQLVQQVLPDRLGQHAAVKVLREELADNEEMVDRFIDETSIMASIEHPGSLPVYGRGEDAHHGRFYAMKKIGGRCLTELLDERGQETSSLMWRRRLPDIFSDVCATVAYAHENGIVHRDLKPDNVMIDEQRRYLLDPVFLRPCLCSLDIEE